MAVTATLSKGTKLQRQFLALTTTTGGFVAFDRINHTANALFKVGAIIRLPTTNVNFGARITGIISSTSFEHNRSIATSSAALEVWDYQDVLKVTSITAPSSSSDQIDVTSHNNTTKYREFLDGGGLLEQGELQVTCSYDPADDDADAVSGGVAAANNDLNALIAGIQENELSNESLGGNVQHIPWRIAFPPSHTDVIEFEAKVTGVSVSSPIDGVHTVDLTMKVHGDITWPA